MFIFQHNTHLSQQTMSSTSPVTHKFEYGIMNISHPNSNTFIALNPLENFQKSFH